MPSEKVKTCPKCGGERVWRFIQYYPKIRWNPRWYCVACGYDPKAVD